MTKKNVRKVEGKPLKLNETTTLHIKDKGDGKAEVTRIDKVGDTKKAHRRMQNACKSGSKVCSECHGHTKWLT